MAVSPSRAWRLRCAGSRARLYLGACTTRRREASGPLDDREGGLESLEALRDSCRPPGQAARSIDQPVAVADRRAVTDAFRVAPVAGLDVPGEARGVDLPAARPAHVGRA